MTWFVVFSSIVLVKIVSGYLVSFVINFIVLVEVVVLLVVFVEFVDDLLSVEFFEIVKEVCVISLWRVDNDVVGLVSVEIGIICVVLEIWRLAGITFKVELI